MKAITSCHECMVGAVSGVGQGQFCPLVERDYSAGHVLYRKGDSASYIWFVKAGVVELDHEDTPDDTTPDVTRPGDARIDDERASTRKNLRRKGPGSFLGLEAMVRDEYGSTARFATAGSLCGATRAGFAQWLGPRNQRTVVLLRDLLNLDEPA